MEKAVEWYDLYRRLLADKKRVITETK
jgi:hypothetical protein